jgi:O-acetyl-ADP-ribose deacetylase (regulator of RNase III)
MVKISIILGDITKIKADAIINASGKHFGSVVGSGVDGAIFNNAGSELRKEAREVQSKQCPNGLEIGQAVITKGYNLPAKFIIHTLGPRYYSENINLLKNCYINCLRLAEEKNCSSIAFPAISTGAYGCPIEKSTEIVKEVLDNFKSEIIQEVILVLWKKEDYEVYKKYFQINL